MEPLIAQAQLFPVAAVVAGLMMLRAGLAKRQLALRHTFGRCPSCGRSRRSEVCSYCTRR